MDCYSSDQIEVEHCRL